MKKNMADETVTIALAGNPNVGKSTIFNILTGMRQHTGNWPGKTVEVASGNYDFEGCSYQIIDLPGTYSLMAHSPEEAVARDFICSGQAKVVIAICDATCLERSLILVYQILEFTKQVVVCLNICDEAEKKGIIIDKNKLEEEIGVPVVQCAAARQKGIHDLQKLVKKVSEETDKKMDDKKIANKEIVGKEEIELGCLQVAEKNVIEKVIIKKDSVSPKIEDIDKAKSYIDMAQKTAALVTTFKKENYRLWDNRIDRIVTGRITSILVMLVLLFVIFWLTICGANYPSDLLQKFLFYIQDKLLLVCQSIHCPYWVYAPLILGVYRVVAWVVSVMLPPLVIFFPLFTILEDFGYLPRIAFNLDTCFGCCGSCGKQGLTMLQGIGCNAVGVTGCRIIDSKRERMIAILTNAFMPCNGRFPIILMILTMFFAQKLGDDLIGSICCALLMTVLLLLAISATFLVSWLLSITLLKGMPSSFSLELPPYRKPQLGKVIIRSIIDRTWIVLKRAVIVSAPAGLVIWLTANIFIGNESLLTYAAQGLNPVGQFMGLDGVILTAFILGFPANEIVLPIMLMGYLCMGTLTETGDLTQIYQLLTANGWTTTTAVCVLLFSLFHWPCSTTCLTIRKETGSVKIMLLAILIPTALGFLLCSLIAMWF